MGMYTYQCPKCGASKMVEHKVAASPYVRCNVCVTTMFRAINLIKKEKDGRNKNT
jgi:predicted nucleic acid-binding Zn ribbon protein